LYLIHVSFSSHSCIAFITTAVTSRNSKKRGSLETKHQAFSYTEILNITDNFKTIVGEGGFGKVYVGVLQNHTQVAVKILSPSSMQGYKEFQ
jgi:predicted unusual protein kinase regulating ubiquinone biosynthesis (AarF/ABC1/UbiB family)